MHLETEQLAVHQRVFRPFVPSTGSVLIISPYPLFSTYPMKGLSDVDEWGKPFLCYCFHAYTHLPTLRSRVRESHVCVFFSSLVASGNATAFSHLPPS